MAEGVVLEPPEAEVVDADAVDVEDGGPQEVPSVFSVTNRYMVGAVNVTPAAEDGSHIVQVYNQQGGVVVELNLSPQLCEFVSTKLVEVEVIEQEEVAPDAGSGE